MSAGRRTHAFFFQAGDGIRDTSVTGVQTCALPISPAERLRSLVARLKVMPPIYDAAKANLVNPPKEFTDLAIRMSKGSVGYFSGTVATWAKDAAGSDAALKKEFDDANARVVAATRDFAAWLEKDLLPRSKGSYAIGAPNFLAKMKYDEGVEIPLAELLAKGEEQLAE